MHRVHLFKEILSKQVVKLKLYSRVLMLFSESPKVFYFPLFVQHSIYLYLADINKLNKIFKINETSLLSSQDDVSYITAYILEAYFYLAMTDYPYPTTFLKPLPAWPLEVILFS